MQRMRPHDADPHRQHRRVPRMFGYALPPKERCTHTLNLIPGDEVVDVDADSEGESRLLRRKRRARVATR